jgi:hypothetical protein
MATKPSSTLNFATSTNFTLGPFIGSPTKVVPPDLTNGFVPGEGVGAAHQNYLHNLWADWATWLDYGSPLAGLDAHVVETDSTGKSHLAMLELGGTAGTTFALEVEANSAAPTAAIYVTNNFGGFGVLGSTSGSSAALRGVQTGTGAGVQGLALGTNNTGVSAQGAGSGAGVTAQGGSSGPGVLATGGASGGSGVLATGGTNGIGLDAVAAGTSPAVRANQSNSGAGNGIEVNLTNALNVGTGVRVTHSGQGRGVDASTSQGIALRGLSTGVGTAIRADQTGTGSGFQSNTASGIGVDVETAGSSNPALVAHQVGSAQPAAKFQADDVGEGDIRLEPKAVVGMNTAGDLGFDSVTDTFTAGDGTSQHHLWMSPKGMAFAGSGVHGTATSTSHLSFTDGATASVILSPKYAGFIYIHATARFGWSAAIDNSLEVELWDDTLGVTIEAQTVGCSYSAGGTAVDINWSVISRYSLPAAGNRTIKLRFKKSSAGGSDLSINDAAILWWGVF